MRTAIVHDWLTGLRGGERCLDAILPLFPDAPIFTLLHHPGTTTAAIEGRTIRTSALQEWPVPRRRYRWLLPFFPWAASRLDLRGFDRVISISHCAAKAAIAPPGAIHISYCLTPMRYAWDQGGMYWTGARLPPPAAPLGALLRAYVRARDEATSRRVDRFVAISRFVAGRIRRVYGRKADAVIPPPVDCASFRPPPAGRAPTGTARRFLVVSALTPYKRVADAVEAFARLDLPLDIVGDGPERKRLEGAAGPGTSFHGRVDEAILREIYASCRALVFPGVEDLGLAPLEAMASGRPVIALGRGGALETVVPPGAGGDAPREPTGILYRRPGPDALAGAVRRFLREEDRFDPDAARRRAMEFDTAVFRRRFGAFVERATARHVGRRNSQSPPVL